MRWAISLEAPLMTLSILPMIILDTAALMAEGYDVSRLHPLFDQIEQEFNRLRVQNAILQVQSASFKEDIKIGFRA